jgi:NAD-dependent SIR2 family protein deacetylase
VAVDEELFQAVGSLPLCPRCGSMARPNILMFDDWDWESQRSSRQEDGLRSWLIRLQNDCAKLVVIEIGAGDSVPTIRMSSERYADLHSAVLVRINPRDYHVHQQKHVSVSAGGLQSIRSIYDLLHD